MCNYNIYLYTGTECWHNFNCCDFICHTYTGFSLLHRATSQKVAGSIPNDVAGIFHSHNPSGRTMAPGVDPTSTRNEYREYFLRGKGGRRVGATLSPTCADCLQGLLLILLNVLQKIRASLWYNILQLPIWLTNLTGKTTRIHEIFKFTFRGWRRKNSRKDRQPILCGILFPLTWPFNTCLRCHHPLRKTLCICAFV
jgi:hypothetical protein